MSKRTFKALVIITLLIVIFPVSVYAVTSSEIEAELMCDCGCGDVLVNCTCERSEEMRAIITGMINEGQSKTQILATFVSQFGEVILSSPPRKGFNLVAYSVPLAGLLVMFCYGLLAGDAEVNWPTAGASSGSWPLALGAVMLPVFFTYSGWNAAAYLAGEMRNPGKDLARGLLGGTAAVMLIYLLMAVVRNRRLAPARRSPSCASTSPTCVAALGLRILSRVN